jgi:hypothetical protein
MSRGECFDDMWVEKKDFEKDRLLVEGFEV